MGALGFGETLAINPRVEFWRDGLWPRETIQYSFLARVVLHLGKTIFKEEWTGGEPSVELTYGIRPIHDVATPQADIQSAVQILYVYHQGYKARADDAFARQQPAPIPFSDEWAVAHAISRQLANQSWAAFKRFTDVVTTLVTLFEMGIVVAARRPHIFGDPQPIPTSHWITEVYPNWFATCQIDPDRPFCGVPVRDGGDWIYVDAESYLAWHRVSFGVLTSSVPRSVAQDGGESGPNNAQTPQGEDPGMERGAQDGKCDTASTEGACDRSATFVEKPTNPSSQSVHLNPAQACAPLNKTASPDKSKPGSKPQYSWSEFNAEVLRRAKAGPLPPSVHALAEDMLVWCFAEWGKEPGNSTVRMRIAKLLRAKGLTLGLTNPS